MEGGGYSDQEMFETLRFDILVRKSMGLMSFEDKVPTESTYYKFFASICEYKEKSGIDLYEQACKHVAREQLSENAEHTCYELNAADMRERFLQLGHLLKQVLAEAKAVSFSGFELLERVFGEQYRTNAETGEKLPTSRTKSGFWRIEDEKDGEKHVRHVKPESIATSMRRKAQKAIPKAKRWLRNDVEAAMFQLTFHTIK